VGDVEDSDTTIAFLTGHEKPTQRLRTADRTRVQSVHTVLESNFAELEEYVDGPLDEDAFYVVDPDTEDTIRKDTFEVYRLTHNYLAALYSLNEAVRATVTTYLPEGEALTKHHFHPDNAVGVEYIRKLMFLRGLRIAAQHGAFSDVLPVNQWDPTKPEYRVAFDRTAFCESEAIENPSYYVRFTSDTRLQRPLEYLGTFHGTHLDEFYGACLSWLNQR
jgi:hypothetical protein